MCNANVMRERKKSSKRVSIVNFPYRRERNDSVKRQFIAHDRQTRAWSWSLHVVIFQTHGRHSQTRKQNARGVIKSIRKYSALYDWSLNIQTFLSWVPTVLLSNSMSLRSPFLNNISHQPNTIYVLVCANAHKDMRSHWKVS